jgi:transcriptional regulator with XRE-family HTH domain
MKYGNFVFYVIYMLQYSKINTIFYMKGYIMDWYGMSDNEIIRDIGRRIKQLRLNKNISQEALSERTGLHRVTLSKIERGQKMSLLTIIQVLRGLDELQRLDNMIPEERLSPLQLAKLQSRQRKRASKKTESLKEKEPEW